MANNILRDSEFADITNANMLVDVYEDKYRHGYMGEWPVEKKQRVLELVKGLSLPDKGDALDFGCGNGEFTRIIKLALPKWTVYGSDISSVAIENAAKRCPDCLFFRTSDGKNNVSRFDFIFTHHVLEHVYDLQKAWHEINALSKDRASVLHILPCGNEGSLEYNICLLNRIGVNGGMGNKFHFEDISHLRRLTTEEMNRYASQFGFSLKAAYYSNQFYGAIDMITLSSPGEIFKMTNAWEGRDWFSALKLACVGFVFLLIKCFRFPANTIDYKRPRMGAYQYYFGFFLFVIFYPFSKLVNICIRYISCWEWKNRKAVKNGSEMYLYYQK